MYLIYRMPHLAQGKAVLPPNRARALWPATATPPPAPAPRQPPPPPHRRRSRRRRRPRCLRARRFLANAVLRQSRRPLHSGRTPAAAQAAHHTTNPASIPACKSVASPGGGGGGRVAGATVIAAHGGASRGVPHHRRRRRTRGIGGVHRCTLRRRQNPCRHPWCQQRCWRWCCCRWRCWRRPRSPPSS